MCGPPRRVARSRSSPSDRLAMIAPSGIGRPVVCSQCSPMSARRVQAVVLVREAGLVDDESGVDLAVPHGGHDLVERHHDDLADAAGHVVRGPQPEQQVRRRASRSARRPSCPVRSDARLAGQHQRAAAAAQRAAAGQQRVVVEDPRQHGVRHLQHVELAALGHAVGDVDVGEGHVEGGRPGDAAVRPGVEDERVVRAGRVGDPQVFAGCQCDGHVGSNSPVRARSFPNASVSAASASPMRQARAVAGADGVGDRADLQHRARRARRPPRRPRSPPSPRRAAPRVTAAQLGGAGGGAGHRGDGQDGAGDARRWPRRRRATRAGGGTVR